MPILRAALLVLAPVLFALGITLPLISVESLIFFEQTPSLVQIVGGLWGEGERSLAAVVALFSIAFPIAKLLVVQVVAISARPAPRWLAALSKWSMTDVLLVALAVFAAKTSGLAVAASQPGLWLYAASAVTAYAASVVGGERREGRIPAAR